MEHIRSLAMSRPFRLPNLDLLTAITQPKAAERLLFSKQSSSHRAYELHDSIYAVCWEAPSTMCLMNPESESQIPSESPSNESKFRVRGQAVSAGMSASHRNADFLRFEA